MQPIGFRLTPDADSAASETARTSIYIIPEGSAFHRIRARVAMAFLILASAACLSASHPEPLKLILRTREENGKVTEKKTQWDAIKTAIIICDMWDKHWCDGATRRVGQMAPAMNEVIREARGRGVFIIHAPSETMAFYKDSPQRLRAMESPKHPTPPLKQLPEEPPLPIDDSDGGCDSGQKPWYRAWTRQHAAIEIAQGDAVSDSGEEVYNLLAERGINHVIIMGVHTNMCVLGRPFAIRRLLALGKEVALMRDMTDAMYNPAMRPNVTHNRGTELVIEHIERHLCPSTTSTSFTGKRPFRFAESEGNRR